MWEGYRIFSRKTFQKVEDVTCSAVANLLAMAPEFPTVKTRILSFISGARAVLCPAYA
jgi:hypothetical protein